VHIAAKAGLPLDVDFQPLSGISWRCRWLPAYSHFFYQSGYFRGANVAANCFAAVRKRAWDSSHTGNCLLPVGKGISAT